MQNHNPKFKTDLKQRAYVFALDIIKFIDSSDKRDFSVAVMAKQLLRSSTSVGANIIEAQAASSKRDFAKFFCYALKSANESKFWLGLFRDSGKANEVKVSQLLQEAHELSNILGSSILTMKGRRK